MDHPAFSIVRLFYNGDAWGEINEYKTYRIRERGKYA